MENFTEEIKSEILDKVIGILEEEMLKRGVTAKIENIQFEKGRVGQYISFKSEPFQTQPVIFKNIIIENMNGLIKKDEDTHRETYTVVLPACYTYSHFSGGFNGCQMFTLFFKIDEDGYIFDIKVKSN